MKFAKNKTISILIVVLLTISMATSMMLIPNSNAHTPPLQIPTYAFIVVAPNLAGIGQTVTINFWLGQPPPTANNVYGDRWQNMTVKVTKPDGTTETLGPFTSDNTGGTYTTYTPTVIGNYTFQMFFGGQTLAGDNLLPSTAPTTKAYVGDYYQPSTSKATTITVQQNPVPQIPQNPLPTTYWDRPIDSVNGLWYSVSGNWLGLGTSTFANSGMYNLTSNYNPYTTAPTTAHILWTQPEAFGGLAGGEFGGSDTSNYYSTAQYEPKFAPIIMNGVLYYELYPGSSTNPVGWNAVDLRTGQTLWTVKNTTQILRTGQLFNYVSPNQFGNLAYLWTCNSAAATGLTGLYASGGSASGNVTYSMWDAMTGSYVLSITNGTILPLTEDQNGNLIGYYANYTTPTAPTLSMWNSSQAILYPSSQFIPGTTAPNWSWRPTQNGVIDFARGIAWTVPLPTTLNNASMPGNFGIATINSGVILLFNIGDSGSRYFNSGFQIEAGYSTDTGTQLWIANRTEVPFSRVSIPTAGNGLFVEFTLQTQTVKAYSLTTGKEAWTTELSNSNAFDSTGSYQTVLANGTLYTWGFGGDIWSIDMQSGKINWQTDTTVLSGPAGTDTPYGVWPLWTFTVGSVGGGILFLPEGHCYSPPLFRGAHQLAVNITDGTLVWDILSFDVTSPAAIADGIMTTINAYDNQIYAYGMGPSKTTVNTPNPVASVGSPVVITGTVTDTSAGTNQERVKANYPNGLPVVSDASMSQFMESVYMQQPMPNNITGIPVTLSVLDSNDNYRTIGTTTTNTLGDFSFTWKPDISGDFTVYATFAGSQSYYSSSASTGIFASEPPATPSPTQAPIQSMADQYLLPGIIGIIVAIVVVGAILALLVTKKRP